MAQSKAVLRRRRQRPLRQLVLIEDCETFEVRQVFTGTAGVAREVKKAERLTGTPHRAVKFIREELTRSGGA